MLHIASSYCADTKQMAPQGLKTEFWSSENWAYNAQTVRNPSNYASGIAMVMAVSKVKSWFSLFFYHFFLTSDGYLNTAPPDTPGKRSTCTPSVYYTESIWPVAADQLTCINKHAADRGTRFNVSVYFYFHFCCKSENSIAVAMNMDNTDTSITWKNRGSLQILLSAYKNRGFKTLCRDLICLYYATLHFFVGYYQSK